VTAALAPISGKPVPRYAAAVCVALFAFAFVAAPYSCDWGLSAYFFAGMATMAALIAMPIRWMPQRTLLARILIGCGLAAIGFAIWVAGFPAANIQILCRLF
jgi:hypothetical protein